MSNQGLCETFRSCSGFRPLTLTATPPKPTEFEHGWSQDHKLAFGREPQRAHRVQPEAVPGPIRRPLGPSGVQVQRWSNFRCGTHHTGAFGQFTQKSNKALSGEGVVVFPRKINTASCRRTTFHASFPPLAKNDVSPQEGHLNSC